MTKHAKEAQVHEHDDDDVPEFTDAVMSRARPAREILASEVMAAFKNKGGRPKAANPKVPISVRLDSDLVDALKASGAGWQTRMNDILRAKVLEG